MKMDKTQDQMTCHECRRLMAWTDSGEYRVACRGGKMPKEQKHPVDCAQDCEFFAPAPAGTRKPTVQAYRKQIAQLKASVTGEMNQ